MATARRFTAWQSIRCGCHGLVAPEYALWGLLHDAGEAYFGDVMSPLKPYLNQRFIERGLNEAVAVAFGLSLPMPEAIHDASRDWFCGVWCRFFAQAPPLASA